MEDKRSELIILTQVGVDYGSGSFDEICAKPKRAYRKLIALAVNGV